MNVRVANVNDIPRLCELLGILFRQEAEFEANDVLQTRALKKIISEPDMGQVLVVESKKYIIGMVNLLYTISTNMGGPAALLEDFIIDPDFRNMGAGTLLISEAISTLKKKNFLRITLLTDKDNEEAQKLYRKFGFINSPMAVMRLTMPL